MEKTGPFKARLFASNPKYRGNPDYESHQILHQKENQVWTTHLSNLQGGKENHLIYVYLLKASIEIINTIDNNEIRLQTLYLHFYG